VSISWEALELSRRPRISSERDPKPVFKNEQNRVLKKDVSDIAQNKVSSQRGKTTTLVIEIEGLSKRITFSNSSQNIEHGRVSSDIEAFLPKKMFKTQYFMVSKLPFFSNLKFFLFCFLIL